MSARLRFGPTRVGAANAKRPLEAGTLVPVARRKGRSYLGRRQIFASLAAVAAALWWFRDRITVDGLLLVTGVAAYNLSGLPFCASLFDADEAKARAIHDACPLANACSGVYTIAWTIDAMARGARGDPTALGAWLAIAPCVPLWMAMTGRCFELEKREAVLIRMRYIFWGVTAATALGSLGCVVPSLSFLPAAVASCLEVGNRVLRLGAPAAAFFGGDDDVAVDFSPGYVAISEVAAWSLLGWGLRAGCPGYYVAKLAVDVVYANLYLAALLWVRLHRSTKRVACAEDDAEAGAAAGYFEAPSRRVKDDKWGAALATDEWRLVMASAHGLLYEQLGYPRWAELERGRLRDQPSRRVSGLEVAAGVTVSLSPIIRGFAPALAVPVVDQAYDELGAALLPLDAVGDRVRGAYRAWRRREPGAVQVAMTPWNREHRLKGSEHAALLAKVGLWQCLERASAVEINPGRSCAGLLNPAAPPTARRVLRLDDRPEISAFRVQYRAWRLLAAAR